jgi:hypothetical protein
MIRAARALGLALLGTLRPAAAAEVAHAQSLGIRGAADESRAQPIHVLILEDVTRGWSARVQGQLSDLPAVVEAGTLGPEPEPELGSIRAVARQRHAALVAWIDAGAAAEHASRPDASYVAIWLAESGLLYRRLLTADWSHLSLADRSGALELAALSVRSAVRSLILDIDVAAPTVAAVEQAGEATADTGPASEVVSPRPAALDVSFGAELGLAWQFYSPAPLGMAGLQLGARLRSGAWGWEALGQLGLPASARVGPAEFELRRDVLALECQYLVWARNAWSFSPLLRAGLVSISREAASERADISPSPASHDLSLLAAAGGLFDYRLSELFGLSVRGLLGWQSWAPTYRVVLDSGETASQATAWALQPAVEVGGNLSW